MNIFRYAVCAVFSLIIHSVAFSSQPELPTLSVQSAHQGESVSIQFQLASPPVTKQAKEKKALEKSKKNAPQTIEKVVKNKVPEQPKKRMNHVHKSPVPKPVPKIEKPIEKTPDTTRSRLNEPKSNSPKVHKTASKEEPVAAKNKVNEQPETQSDEQVVKQKETSSQQNNAQAALPKLVSKPLFKTKPSAITYPRMARRRNMEGETVIEVWLDKQGLQIKRNIFKSSGFEILDKAAMRSIANWKFERYQQSGQSFAHRVRIPVKFKLD